MTEHVDKELNVRDRVINLVALPGVPAGTAGRVILKNGFDWIRYRVLFDTGAVNGTDVGSLNRAQLTLVNKKGLPV